MILNNLYHGSSYKFTEFDFREIGKHGTAEGKGFYFSDKQDIAKRYSNLDDHIGYLYSCQLDIKNTIENNVKKFTKADVRKLVVEVQKTRDLLSNYGEVEFEGYNNILNRAVDSLYNYSADDVEIICDIANSIDGIGDVNRALLKLFNINCIIEKTPSWSQERGHTVYVALIPEMIQIKKVEQIVVEKQFN